MASSIGAVLVMLFPVVASAQGPAARDYLNTPVNQVRFLFEVVGSNAETAAAADIPLPNNVTVNRNGFLSLLYSFPLAHRYGGIQVNGAYARVKLSGPLGKVQTAGFTDPSITFHANIFGAPALRLEQFPKWTPQTFSSFHLTVNFPLGSYDPNSAVNTGANRWTFTPVLNLSITPDKGVSWIDLYGGARFGTNNNEFRGHNQFSQDPLWVLTAHYSHKIRKQTWAGIGVHYDNGGQSFINHIAQHDYANGFRPAVIVGTKLGRFSITLRYENTASRPNAEPTNSLLALRFAGPIWAHF